MTIQSRARIALLAAFLIAGSAAGGERVLTPESRAPDAWSAIRSGEYARAARLFTEVSRRFPEDASLQLGLGVSHYRMAQYDPAAEALNRALALDPDLDEAHVLLGDLYVTHDELLASIRHYEAAVRRDSTDATAHDGLFAARRAWRAEQDMDRVRSAHFILKFDATYRDLAGDVLDRVERLHRLMGPQLGWTADDPTIIILYSDRRFIDLMGGPGWAGGLYDGKIHLAAATLTGKGKKIGAALAHEYAHAIVHRLSGGHAPAWLHEGLALYFEGRPASWSRDVLDRRRGDLMPLHALHGSFLSLPAGEAELAYAEGYSATRAIIDRYDFAKVRRLLIALAANPAFGTVFEQIFHQPYRDFETAWVSGVMRRRA